MEKVYNGLTNELDHGALLDGIVKELPELVPVRKPSKHSKIDRNKHRPLEGMSQRQLAFNVLMAECWTWMRTRHDFVWEQAEEDFWQTSGLPRPEWGKTEWLASQPRRMVVLVKRLYYARWFEHLGDTDTNSKTDDWDDVSSDDDDSGSIVVSLESPKEPDGKMGHIKVTAKPGAKGSVTVTDSLTTTTTTQVVEELVKATDKGSSCRVGYNSTDETVDMDVRHLQEQRDSETVRLLVDE